MPADTTALETNHIDSTIFRSQPELAPSYVLGVVLKARHGPFAGLPVIRDRGW